ncbi:hypothetical protein GEMRC1_002529 [Eukaryota sp. GEM-RC1]
MGNFMSSGFILIPLMAYSLASVLITRSSLAFGKTSCIETLIIDLIPLSASSWVVVHLFLIVSFSCPCFFFSSSVRGFKSLDTWAIQSRDVINGACQIANCFRFGHLH